MTHKVTHHTRLTALLIFFTFSPFQLFTSSAFAQKRQMAEAENYLRSGKNYDKAEQLMTNLLKDSANQQNLRIYDLWLQAVEKQYQAINEKMYKHQAVDTLKLFTLNRRIFSIAETLDSIDARPDKKGRVSPDYRKDLYRLYQPAAILRPEPLSQRRADRGGSLLGHLLRLSHERSRAHPPSSRTRTSRYQ